MYAWQVFMKINLAECGDSNAAFCQINHILIFDFLSQNNMLIFPPDLFSQYAAGEMLCRTIEQ